MIPEDLGEFHFVIHQAGADDADAIVAHRIALYQPTLSLHPDQEVIFANAARRAFVEGVANTTCLAWIASSADTGNVVGSAAMQIVPRLPAPQNLSEAEGYVAQLFVQPTWRRRGVGSGLMRVILAEARRRKLGRVRLHSSRDAVELYASLGFQLRTMDMELFL